MVTMTHGLGMCGCGHVQIADEKTRVLPRHVRLRNILKHI